MSKSAERKDDDAGAVSTPGWVPIVALLVGLGAIASTARPLLRQHFAAKAKGAPAAVGSKAGNVVGAAAIEAQAAELGPMLERLRELQRGHQARHPLWYGRPTPEFVAEMKAAMESANTPPPPPGADEASPAASAPNAPLR